MLVSIITEGDLHNYKVRDTDEGCSDCSMFPGVVVIKGRGFCWSCAFQLALNHIAGSRQIPGVFTKKIQWGGWVLDAAENTLDFPAYGACKVSYCVPLFASDASFTAYTDWLGHWVEHLSEKSWFTPRVLHDFVDAVQDIFHRKEL
jgi:hypothetical protein